MAPLDASLQPLERLLADLSRHTLGTGHLLNVLASFEKYIGALAKTFSQTAPARSQELQAIKTKIQETHQGLKSLPPCGKGLLQDVEEELHTVVTTAEKAANTIMEQAEEILSANTSNISEYLETVADAVTQIFEACSFQDITGQRLQNVMINLSTVTQRMEKYVAAVGAPSQKDDTVSDEDRRKQTLLLHGPAKNGEGISQDDVDALFD